MLLVQSHDAALGHPFVNEGQFASLLLRDRELAELWRKATRSLREIAVDPRQAPE